MDIRAHSPTTPATAAAGELLTRIAIDADPHGHYPNRLVLIPADSPDVSSLTIGAIAERRPFALVLPDGSDILVRAPERCGFGRAIARIVFWLAERIERGHNEPKSVPRGWVTDYHPARR